MSNPNGAELIENSPQTIGGNLWPAHRAADATEPVGHQKILSSTVNNLWPFNIDLESRQWSWMLYCKREIGSFGAPIRPNL